MGWSEAHSALVRRETGSEQELGSVRTSTVERCLSAAQVVSMTSTTSGVSGKPAATAVALGMVGAWPAQMSSMLTSSPSGSALIVADRSPWSSAGGSGSRTHAR
jgi:hypothetical protein